MMPSVFRKPAVLGLMLLLAGCVMPTKIVSRKADDANPTRKRVLLRSHLADSRTGATFGPQFGSAFDAQLVSILKACGSEVSVLDVSGLEMDSNEDFVKALDAFKPDTVITVVKDRGTVSAPGELISVTYGVHLYDCAGIPEVGKHLQKGGALKAIWRSSVEFHRGGTMIPIESRGQALAREVTNAMKRDGFFPGCAPTEEPGSAGSQPAAAASVD